MNSHGFKEIDHTADLALCVWAEDYYGLLEQAALGLYQLLEVERHKEANLEHSFSIEDGPREAVLVDFLNELLFLCEDQGLLFHSFSFTMEGRTLDVKAWGEDTASPKRDIKAVTFHDLEISEENSGLTTTITFDV